SSPLVSMLVSSPVIAVVSSPPAIAVSPALVPAPLALPALLLLPPVPLEQPAKRSIIAPRPTAMTRFGLDFSASIILCIMRSAFDTHHRRGHKLPHSFRTVTDRYNGSDAIFRRFRLGFCNRLTAG